MKILFFTILLFSNLHCIADTNIFLINKSYPVSKQEDQYFSNDLSKTIDTENFFENDKSSLIPGNEEKYPNNKFNIKQFINQNLYLLFFIAILFIINLFLTTIFIVQKLKLKKIKRAFLNNNLKPKFINENLDNYLFNEIKNQKQKSRLKELEKLENILNRIYFVANEYKYKDFAIELLECFEQNFNIKHHKTSSFIFNEKKYLDENLYKVSEKIEDGEIAEILYPAWTANNITIIKGTIKPQK